MDIEKRIELITRAPTEEVITTDDLRKLLETKDKVTAYLGIAPTGPFHLGYLIPLSKLFDFSNAGIENKILVADIHAALDDLKTPWEELEKRSEYYKKCIELSVPWKKKPKFIRGSSFQLDKKYVNDVLKLSTLTTVTRATRAASEVTRMKNPKVSELIYPLMQCLDEEYLDVDIQLGGIDQRHILAFAREGLPILNYRARVEVMTSLMVSLKGPGIKMSASIPESSIKVYESEESINKKIGNAYCPAGVVEGNPILQIAKYIIFPLNGKFKIEREKKFGGDIEFENYIQLEKAFIENKLHPQDIKKATSSILINLFSKARKYFAKNTEMLNDLGSNFLSV